MYRNTIFNAPSSGFARADVDRIAPQISLNLELADVQSSQDRPTEKHTSEILTDEAILYSN